MLVTELEIFHLDLSQMSERMAFFKNTAIVGGLLLLLSRPQSN